MRLRLGFLSVLPLLGWAVPAPAQEPEPVAPAFVVPVSTERVEVDLVVRDRHGALVRDLRAGEVEVIEDGVRQDVESLTLVERASTDTATDDPIFLALVFDRLSPAARHFARGAAARYLAQDGRPGLEAGVFSIDRGLTVLQPFTDDVSAVRRAVEATTSLVPTTLAGKRERELTRNAYHGLGEGLGQAHVASAESRGAPECRGREEVRIRLSELLQSRLVEGFESLERDQQGFGSTHALLALVGALGSLPGRKAVMLFSEGLAIPTSVESTYDALIGAANQARVSFYTADAGGLRVESPADELRRTVDTVKTRSQYDMEGRLTEDGRLALLEKNLDALRLAPANTLEPLADRTGGFAIGGTNDISAGLLQLGEELRAHYVLSYAPKNRAFDGRFRAITVKVGRPHARVRARKGYLALRTALPVPALPHEVKALARLDSRPLPKDLPVRVRGLQFPEEPGSSSRVPILVEVPAQAFRFDRDEKARVFRQDFTIVVLVKDASGGVVAKTSQHYPLEGPLRRLDEARRGQVLFYREVRLPAGSYTLEAVALDARSGRAGAALGALEVPPADPGRLRASSLMVVRRAEKLPAGEGQKHGPLQYGGVLLYPDLGEELRTEVGRPLAFFLSAWPAPARPGIDARVEVLRSGRPVAASAPFGLRPDADGRIGIVSTFPVDTLAPGAYELRVTLTDGRDAEARTTALDISP